MKNFLKIVGVYVGAFFFFFFSSARMCGLYLIVIQICLYLYTAYMNTGRHIRIHVINRSRTLETHDLTCLWCGMCGFFYFFLFSVSTIYRKIILT